MKDTHVRRSFLEAVTTTATIGVAALAGCSSFGGSNITVNITNEIEDTVEVLEHEVVEVEEQGLQAAGVEVDIKNLTDESQLIRASGEFYDSETLVDDTESFAGDGLPESGQERFQLLITGTTDDFDRVEVTVSDPVS